MNWCEYVADYLIQGIREYNESNATNIFVHGCVHILLEFNLGSRVRILHYGAIGTTGFHSHQAAGENPLFLIHIAVVRII